LVPPLKGAISATVD